MAQTATQLPPGPSDIPMLGSARFFFDKYVMRTPTADLLLSYLHELPCACPMSHGKFGLAFGPWLARLAARAEAF